MPTISIVLPVYGVAGYLRECLDSILDQDYHGVEIIAVDDCSPDTSASILDEYAQADSRLRVIHLDRNRGLGGARNVGAAAATGDYIWFVDSDDWLEPGSLSAIGRRLIETKPDVLLIDFAKVGITRKAKRSSLRWRVPAEQVPDVFSAKDFPGVLRALHTAWSRIMRRDWLADLDIPFQSAWYEDVSFTYAVTAAAERIAVLHRVCYNYRVGRQGSITSSAGADRHFEIFDQYEIVFGDFDRLGVNHPAVRAAMYERMQVHYRYVLGNTRRVPRSRRREFFERMSEHSRRYRPAAVAPPRTALERIKRRLINGEAWRTFEAARDVKAVVNGAKGLCSKATKRVKSLVRTARGLVRSRVYYSIQRRLPLDPNLAVYSAYWGRGYRCNPAAIYEKAAEVAPHVHGVFVVKAKWRDGIPDGVDAVIQGSRPYFRALARAKYLINNVNFENRFAKRPGQLFLQTHHGTPLKAMGADHYRYPLIAAAIDLKALTRKTSLWDYSISTSPFNTEVWQRAFPGQHETLEIGYPRNDRLTKATSEDVAAARARLGLADDEIAVLFAPTHREYHTGFKPMLDVEALADALGARFRILLRAHYFYAASGGISHPQVLDVSTDQDIEPLLLATDVLVTDYSSVMFDFAYLDRPIVIFAPDWETYQTIRGVTFDLMATPPGVVTRSAAALTSMLRSAAFDTPQATEARRRFIERFCPETGGRSSELAVRRLFLNEPVARPNPDATVSLPVQGAPSMIVGASGG